MTVKLFGLSRILDGGSTLSDNRSPAKFRWRTAKPEGVPKILWHWINILRSFDPVHVCRLKPAVVGTPKLREGRRFYGYPNQRATSNYLLAAIASQKREKNRSLECPLLHSVCGDFHSDAGKKGRLIVSLPSCSVGKFDGRGSDKFEVWSLTELNDRISLGRI